jgi:hypothetical protein
MSVALGDVNGDGVPDIICATRGVRAGKVKVFSGATALNLDDPLGPSDTIFQKVVITGYTQGLTVAAGDIGSTTDADIIVGARSTTLSTGTKMAATVLVFSGDTATSPYTQIASFKPFTSTYTGGVYVAAGPTTDGGKAQIAVSGTTTSDVQIWSLDTGTPVMSEEFNPFGTTTAFTASKGDGQVEAVGSTTAGVDDFATAHLASGVVTVDVNTAAGTQAGTYTSGTGVTFFAIGQINPTATPPDDLMIAVAGGTDIGLVNGITGAAVTPDSLPAILALTGKFTIAGAL